MTSGSLKRSLEEGKEQAVVHFWFNSDSSHKCGALFKLKLIIDGDNIHPKLNQLTFLHAFFDQHPYRRMIFYASCTPFIVGSACKFLLMPNEFHPPSQELFYSHNIYLPCELTPYIREKPCLYVFDPLCEKSYHTSLEKLPLALKVCPIAVTVSNKVYLLSRRSGVGGQMVLPEPTFEAFDPEKDSWETLPQPWINGNTPPYIPSPDSTQYWDSPGYAVFDHFIIVCSSNRGSRAKFLIQTYNTISQEWNPVHCPDDDDLPKVVYRDDGCSFFNDDDTNDDDSDDEGYHYQYHAADYLVWEGEAIVVNGFVYAYVGKYFETLVSYKSCWAEDNCLSFDGSIAVERREFRKHWVSSIPFSCLMVSGAVGKIRDDLICLLKTVSIPSAACDLNSQPVHLMVFRLHEEGGISTLLKSCDLIMPVNNDFSDASISSCFVLPPEVASKWMHRKRCPKKRELSDESGADASLASDTEMKETTGIA